MILDEAWIGGPGPSGNRVKDRQKGYFLLLTAVLNVGTGFLRAQAATEPIPTSDVPQLREWLLDPGSKQEQREIAARRLLARPGNQARQVIRDALIEVSQPGAQLAAAKALAEIPTVDPRLIDPLFALMDASNRRETIEAAAWALGSYKDDTGVLTRLLSMARSTTLDMTVRLAAIRSLGTFVEKRVARTLLDLMDPTAQPTAINTASQQALAYMTGLDPETTTPSDWSAWWQQNADKSDLQFKADLVLSRANRYDAARLQVEELQREMITVLEDQYRKSAPDQRPELLSRFLRASQPAIRAAGARIIGNAVVAGEFVSPSVRGQLRDLIGDSHALVRKQVAQTLAVMNDPDAIVPLLTQLNQEPDSTVRAAIAQAVAPIRDLRSVEPLLALLDDPRIETARAAAVALSDPDLGKQLQSSNPATADRAAQKLMQTLFDRTSPTNETDLRSDLVRAVGAMRSASQGQALARLLSSPAEAPKVRRSLLWAAGQLRLPELADPVAQCLSDPDPTVRLSAIKALGQTANSFSQHQQLTELLDPIGGEKTEIGEAAWTVLSDLFKLAPTNQLVQFGVRFKSPDPPPGQKPNEQLIREAALRRIVVLRILRDRARASGNVNDLATYEQQLGDTAIEAGLYDEAVASLRNSLRIADELKDGPRQEFVSESLITALLRARQFSEAIRFYEQQTQKDRRFQKALSFRIRSEAERLFDETRDIEAARQLISLALASTPPLPDIQQDMLRALEQRIQDRLREQNLRELPDLPVNALAN